MRVFTVACDDKVWRIASVLEHVAVVSQRQTGSFRDRDSYTFKRRVKTDLKSLGRAHA